MKKLISIFIALFAVVLIAGCGARQNTVRFNNGETTNEESEEVAEVGETEGEVEGETIKIEVEESMEDGEGEMEEEAETNEEEKMEDEEITSPMSEGKLAVTSLDGAHLKTNLSYNVVKGTAPSDTHKITINGYKLQKYIAGQTQWDYVASTRFGSLKDGTNNYILKSFDKDGDETASLMFAIDYEAPAIPDGLPDVGNSHWLTLIIAMMSTGSYALFRKLKWL